jgi:hypothetical protein
MDSETCGIQLMSVQCYSYSAMKVQCFVNTLEKKKNYEANTYIGASYHAMAEYSIVVGLYSI